jgi:hypothetical protein
MVTAMGTRTTYRERFEQSLEEDIAAGGDVSRMVTLVNIYQGADSTARHFAFREWLDAASLSCGRCAIASTLMKTEDIEEDDEVLCDWCRKGSVNFGAEPALGWRRRAFARW